MWLLLFFNFWAEIGKRFWTICSRSDLFCKRMPPQSFLHLPAFRSSKWNEIRHTKMHKKPYVTKNCWNFFLLELLHSMSTTLYNLATVTDSRLARMIDVLDSSNPLIFSSAGQMIERPRAILNSGCYLWVEGETGPAAIENSWNFCILMGRGGAII